jgi:hypothetical protein
LKNEKDEDEMKKGKRQVPGDIYTSPEKRTTQENVPEKPKNREDVI